MTDENELTAANPPRAPKQSVTRVGNHRLKPATLMMGHGFDPVLSEGSLKPPIFLTSTFVFENAAAGKRFFEGVTGKRPGGAEGLVYSRFNGPNQEILEDRLAVWEDAEEALAFSSGMTAITSLLLAFVGSGDVVVHSGPLYAATETILNKIMARFGVQYVDFPAGATREELDAVAETWVDCALRLEDRDINVGRTVGTSNLEEHFRGYTLADLAATFDTRFGKFGLAVENLTDRQYIGYYPQSANYKEAASYFAGRGRTLSASVSRAAVRVAVSRKRTSIFDGWTLTSTSAGSRSSAST